MDLLTQGLLGATLAQSGSKVKDARIAGGVGFAAGLLADADALIRSEQDSLLNIEFHRHFSHSLFFIPPGALLASIILWPFLRRRLRFFQLYLFCLFGYAGSGLLDACTSYGTMLLWPISDERIAWNIISIVDPVFTLTLLFCILAGLIKYRPAWARMGMLFVVSYMSLGWMQNQRAELQARELAQSRGHQVEQILVKPTLGNLLLWRSIYQTSDRYYVDAVRLGVFSENRIYPGESISIMDSQQLQKLAPEGSVLAEDIKRFVHFSGGYAVLHPEKNNVLGDVRYAMVPNEISPIWGIELAAESHQHASFKNYREEIQHSRHSFFAMLLARELSQ